MKHKYSKIRVFDHPNTANEDGESNKMVDDRILVSTSTVEAWNVKCITLRFRLRLPCPGSHTKRKFIPFFYSLPAIAPAFAFQV